MGSSVPLLKLDGVTKRYASPAGGKDLAVLEEISFEMNRGDSLAVIGPSGSGKSTLLQIIGTLDEPTAGGVFLSGQKLSDLDANAIAAVRNTQIGFVFQAHYLLPQCTVLENVLVPTLALPKKRNDSGVQSKQIESAETRAHRLLTRVGLGARLHHRPGELSGGERQRVAVVRALINQPALLLADEPTGSLDHVSATQLAELLVELNREEGVALVLVTHALELARRMQKVFRLTDGRLAIPS